VRVGAAAVVVDAHDLAVAKNDDLEEARDEAAGTEALESLAPQQHEHAVAELDHLADAIEEIYRLARRADHGALRLHLHDDATWHPAKEDAWKPCENADEVVRTMLWRADANRLRPGEMFGYGGGEALAAQLDVPLLGQVPLDALLREQGDAGVPIVAAFPEAESAQAIVAIADAILARREAGSIVKSLPLVS
jgi:ribosomal protein L11 methylase PrmA